MMNAFIFPLQLNRHSSFHPDPRTFDNLADIQVLNSVDTAIVLDRTTHVVKVYRVEKRFLTYASTSIRQFYAIVDDFAPGLGIIEEDRDYITGPVGKEKRNTIETWVLTDVRLKRPAQ
jgi:hypothetical protein